jgi:hypothetical protein
MVPTGEGEGHSTPHAAAADPIPTTLQYQVALAFVAWSVMRRHSASAYPDPHQAETLNRIGTIYLGLIARLARALLTSQGPTASSSGPTLFPPPPTPAQSAWNTKSLSPTVPATATATGPGPPSPWTRYGPRPTSTTRTKSRRKVCSPRRRTTTDSRTVRMGRTSVPLGGLRLFRKSGMIRLRMCLLRESEVVHGCVCECDCKCECE